MNDLCLKFLDVGTAKESRRIAVRARPRAQQGAEGEQQGAQEAAAPGLLWLGGFKSDMKGTKAEALAR